LRIICEKIKLMRKLHTFQMHERAQAAMIRDMLEQEGIACLLRNDQLFGAIGEIPLIECFPELWVVDDEVYPRASLLLKGLLRADESLEGWTCPRCSEDLEGQFGACWRCGGSREK
jgi:hypothetical protein